jgi:hypothetical protein
VVAHDQLGGAGAWGAILAALGVGSVPPDVLSRVSSYDWFGSVAFVPLGYLIAGPAAGLIGTRAWPAVPE